MSGDNDHHKVFTNDPLWHQSMLHCRVAVTTTNHTQHTGWVYTIDPVSESVILVEFDDKDGKEVIILSGYNVENVKVINSNPPEGLASTIGNLFKKEQVHYSNQELTARRESLCVWLAENRVPYTVREDMGIQVLQVAVISQPYEPESVQCTNEVVLDKVMKLVQQMPIPGNTTSSDTTGIECTSRDVRKDMK
ncbi:gem-associated protein 6-like [Homarus americanus]|uniref:Gem-associated protein 6-like n=1 Tax=Homarus americanus TaxID=6706 RepID=A0A8J5TND7_HOMAM|nr:gem-associated protein 6-like [Homarus americanus]XP_042207271.1 gem-associated protein 6-like [Homarus americanus]XP_042207280.1 gem-associated protein 6-like [Homarus americanus]XP_042207287.1 gem-associated protein 6-like [Homarus americanus]XP_042207295.1 gem-associated protein 6-like [Homarus americanus]KAG7175817.1 Gem-associated protein 6-like [Homarus americanus]